MEARTHGRGWALTKRQREIVRGLLEGLTNRELAKSLGLREQTVKNQLSIIYSKLGVRNRLELAVQAGRRAPPDDGTDDRKDHR